MPNDVHVPILGNMPKGAVLAGGLAVVGVGGYLLYKHVTKPKTATATGASTGAYGYGQGAYGYGTYGYGYYGYGDGYGSGGFGGGGYYPPYGGYGYGGGGGGGGGPATNQQWVAAVTPQLKAAGYTTTAVVAALGAYLIGANIPNPSTSYTIVQAAIGIEGPPPQPGADGSHPPAINSGGGKGGGGVTWKTISAPGNERLATMANQTDPSVPWSLVIGHNIWALRFEGKNIPKGYKVSLPFPTAS